MFTDKLIESLKPQDKSYTKTVLPNLFLLVEPNGKKYWRLRYTFNCKSRLLSVGKFPIVGVDKAIEKRYELLKLIEGGIDPIKLKKEKRAEETGKNTFNEVFNEYVSTLDIKINYEKRLRHYVTKYLKNTIGNRKVDSFEAYELIQLCKKIKSPFIASEVLNIIKRTLRYAKINGLIKISPLEDTGGAIKKPKINHHPCVIDGVHNKSERMIAIGKLLRDISDSKCTFIVKHALGMLAFLFVRPGELISMKWKDIDFEEKVWRYKSEKTNIQHIVPLVSSIINNLQRIKDKNYNEEWVFYNRKNPRKHLLIGSLSSALIDMGHEKKMVPHGFRAIARTVIEEDLKYPPHLIELQLTHKVKDTLGRAYNRTMFIQERTKMMNEWSNYLKGCLKIVNQNSF